MLNQQEEKLLAERAIHCQHEGYIFFTKRECWALLECLDRLERRRHWQPTKFLGLTRLARCASILSSRRCFYSDWLIYRSSGADDAELEDEVQ